MLLLRLFHGLSLRDDRSPCPQSVQGNLDSRPSWHCILLSLLLGRCLILLCLSVSVFTVLVVIGPNSQGGCEVQ